MAVLDADEWDEKLKQLAGRTEADPAVVREGVRRLNAGLLTTRDMRLVLLSTGHLTGWQPPRRAVTRTVIHQASRSTSPVGASGITRAAIR
ncbi:hypothetical protein EASAB2608_01004 [Streptomyces sp. EAS-AB2608]|uniref:hypothetical protein n=1 Tax=Streptomyces sp. EAS-AB2608 TaxID=2779671 RepID=UPI001BEFF9D4|nr:hypothetical protein [Streptomyces sp. EAS-AB2608]BCM65670.1 hypothetical protein EASAB2608_01004 [Streptomyces sp. EAS-AB2608]